jgi:hypothetical protein
MHSNAQYTLQLSQERIQRDIEHAAAMRRAARSETSIRRTVGHRIIRIGQRLAAEPSLELARSR